MYKFLSVGLLAVVTMASAAEAKSGIKIGVLSCEVDGGVGFIIGSSKGRLSGPDCQIVYHHAASKSQEKYQGTPASLPPPVMRCLGRSESLSWHRQRRPSAKGPSPYGG